jgi:hypothetical protein
VRRASIASALLILVLATSAFGCATGWRSEPGTFCFRQSSREACAGKKPNTRAGGWSACSHTLKSLPGVCNLRTFAQFRFVEFRRFEVAGPLGNPGGKVSLRSNSPIIALSIGSPQTDRGPPS